jgi:hypothetical protein
MKVLVVTSGQAPWNHRLLHAVEERARMDPFGEHVLTDDPHDADLILFLDLHQHPDDWSMRSFRNHQLVRQFPTKVFVYDERDSPRALLPGLYVSMPSSKFDRTRHRAFAYCFLRNDTRAIHNPRPDLLFSFQGRRISDVRNTVLELTHARAVIEDTSAHDFFGELDLATHELTSRYREIVGRSKFVLCPRGAGTSSLRLFETLACGRVPVILSDEWAEPRGIDWATCSIRIPERDALSIPARLEALEPAWPEMSATARRVYDEWFAPEVWFHRAVEHCRELQEIGSTGVRPQWRDPALWRDGARRWKRVLTR